MAFSTRYLKTLSMALSSTEVFDRAGLSQTIDSSLDGLVEAVRRTQKSNHCLWFAGNGASAAMSSHMALDFSKNARVRSLALNDAASLTAIGNDLGFEHIFGQPLQWHGVKGDGLVLVSSSGTSPNMLAAAEVGRQKGMWIVTLTGLNEDNPLRRLGDLNYFIDARSYGIVECSHQVLLHMWLDRLMGVEDWSMQESQNMRLTS
jgi:D-sedoheptulose 7-phosphate isomerase